MNVLLTPRIPRISHRHNWYDHQNHRKIHTENTPRLGGVGIFVAFLAVLLLGSRFVVPAGGAVGLRPVAIAGGFLLIHAVGLYDDFVNVKAPIKFAAQILAALAVVLGGAVIRSLTVPWFGTLVLPAAVGIPLTVFWIVAVSNALNLIDGADGLSGGIAASSALFMGVLAFSRGNALAAVSAFALFGSLAGFLVYNMPPARIFMGDCGSLFVGFALAVIPILGLNGRVGEVALLPVVSLLFLPIIDTSMAIARRTLRGQPIHFADREHIHHRLIDRGFVGVRLLAVAYSANVVLGLVALAWYALPTRTATLLTGATWLTVWGILLLLGKRRLR